MPHETPLISTLVAGLGLAFLFGMVAVRLRISPLVGYLLAGVAVGPFTPGYVADAELATELAEIGVILLMFGVGLHFSLKDLLSVRKIALPGAVAQISFATLLGVGLAYLMGWSVETGIVFGLALSVASTVVLLRALQERRLVQTERGKIAVGWLIVEDIAMILALVLLPAWALIREDIGATGAFGPEQVRQVAVALGATGLKVGAFVLTMLVIGRRVIPWLLHRVIHTGSREMFRLAVLAIALCTAFGAASLFEVSFALGAFFAGMIMAESELSQQAANETLPLRDAFAVLFFVSVGMLFNPAVVTEAPWALVATVAIIVVGKSAAALAIMHVFGQSPRSGILIAASLAQIGEFSFILASLGYGLDMLPELARDLILGGAILSIMLNPLIFYFADRVQEKRPAVEVASPGSAVIAGYGRVGSLIGAALKKAGVPFTVIEDNQPVVDRLRSEGVPVVAGNAASDAILAKARPGAARWLFVALPDGFEAGSVVETARAANSDLQIIARAHSEAEEDHVRHYGANHVVSGEEEIARAMVAAAGPISVAAPALAAAPVGGRRKPRSASGKYVIVDDAERALLNALRDKGIGPMEAISLADVRDLTLKRYGFDADRLNQAARDLITKALIIDFGDGRIKLTNAGYLEANRFKR